MDVEVEPRELLPLPPPTALPVVGLIIAPLADWPAVSIMPPAAVPVEPRTAGVDWPKAPPVREPEDVFAVRPGRTALGTIEPFKVLCKGIKKKNC